MIPEEAKKMLEWWDRNRPAVEAFSEGKPVQFRTSAAWKTAGNPSFNQLHDWRPAPEPTLRPYTDEELRGMVGKVFVDKENGAVHLADSYADDELHLAEWGYLSTAELLRSCTHIDGSPCGVME